MIEEDFSPHKVQLDRSPNGQVHNVEPEIGMEALRYNGSWNYWKAEDVFELDFLSQVHDSAVSSPFY